MHQALTHHQPPRREFPVTSSYYWSNIWTTSWVAFLALSLVRLVFDFELSHMSKSTDPVVLSNSFLSVIHVCRALTVSQVAYLETQDKRLSLFFFSYKHGCSFSIWSSPDLNYQYQNYFCATMTFRYSHISSVDSHVQGNLVLEQGLWERHYYFASIKATLGSPVR